MEDFCNIASQFLDVDYKLCGQSTAEGLDCFTLIVEYFRKLGKELPADYNYEGITLTSYASSYLEKPVEMIYAAIDYIRGIAKEIRVEYAMAGDILFLKLKSSKQDAGYFGIDIGRNNVLLLSTNRGAVVVQKNVLKIYRAFRVEREV